nr:hypothetical protein [Tanacetum cinerariifolium]
MRDDELYKFSDRTLKKVWDELHHRIRDFRLVCNKEMPKRKWTTIDSKRLFTSRLLNATCKKVLNLLKKGLLIWGKLRQLLVRDYEGDLRLLERTI